MRIFIVAGGTGGHLFPAISLAEDIASRGVAEILFITSSRAQDMNILQKKNIKFQTLPIIGMQFRNIVAILSFVARLFAGTLKSIYLLFHFRPDCVIGFGGYVSGPIVFLASLFGARAIIHEQNVYPGKTNRILARFVDRIAVNFPESIEYLKGFESKVLVSGNPLRSDLKRTKRTKGIFDQIDNRSPAGFTVLVMGGSQGAHALNRFVPEALALIGPDKRNALEVIHIAGYREKEEVEKSYKDKGITNRVFSFTHDMDRLYCESDFVIARAGATTVSELMYLAKPSILIPYPYVRGHQSLNAKVLENAGLAILIEEKGFKIEALRDAVTRLMDKNILAEMSDKVTGRDDRDPCDILIKEVLGWIR